MSNKKANSQPNISIKGLTATINEKGEYHNNYAKKMSKNGLGFKEKNSILELSIHR